MKILVLGYIVRGPLGGLAWHHLQYVLGLKQLGHDVLFVEDSDDFPGCYNPDTFVLGEDPAYGLRFIQTLFNSFELNEHWAYYDAHTNNWFGATKQKVLSFCKEADMVLNISGVNPVRDWWVKIHYRVFIDTDPGFTQIRHLTETSAHNLAAYHNHFFSFAENIRKPGCTIPVDGFDWHATRQPVFLDAWKVSPAVPYSKWTTVMQWDSYKDREYQGQKFGMKSISFKDFDNLPLLLPNETFELALGSSTAPVDELRQKGWQVISSLIPTKTPWTYQRYIEQSKGEWSVAKHGYVTSNSGWFSERSLCYMASGKPVVVQDTGFSNTLETGAGLLSFKTMEEAAEAIMRINTEYAFHGRKARLIVEENFAAAKVLQSLINLI